MDEGQQRSVLRKYLLGELSESERSQLANQYFVDENLFDELLDVENELLDQYARGQLQPAETKNFREYLASLPDGRTKLATAYTLNKARTSPLTFSEERQAAAVAALPSRWQSLRHIPQYVAVVIIFALLCGLAYLLTSRRALRREVEQLRAERTQAEQENLNSQQQTRIAQDNEAMLRDRNLQLERDLAQLRGQAKQQNDNRDVSAVAVHILSPALRSVTEPDSITISDATKSVVLVMPIPKDEQITNYSARLRIGGELVWTNERLIPQRSHQGRTVSLRLPTARLTQSTYKLTLLGKAADNVEIAHDFYFNIVRK